MLQTTVAYLNVVESKRHNLVTERQTDVDLAIKQGELQVHRGQLAENIRHNSVVEAQGWASILETNRHNLVTESIQAKDAETRRKQLEVSWYEAYTHRYSAEQTASIGWANVAINQGQLEVSQRRVNNDFVIGMSSYQNSYSQAETAKQNADTREAELSHKVDYDTSMVNIGQQNADANTMNAETNQSKLAIDAWNAAINQQNANTNKKKQKQDKVTNFSKEIREWFKVIPEGTRLGWWSLITD